MKTLRCVTAQGNFIESVLCFFSTLFVQAYNGRFGRNAPIRGSGSLINSEWVLTAAQNFPPNEQRHQGHLLTFGGWCLMGLWGRKLFRKK